MNVGYLKVERRRERLARIWTRDIDGLTVLDYVTRLKENGLYSVKGRLLRTDLIQIWKAFHSDIYVGLSDIFEYARNIRTRGHAYTHSILLCRKDVIERSFAVRCVSIWNSISAEAVAYNIVETFKAQLDKILTHSLCEIS